MEGLDLFGKEHFWQPLARFGLTNPAFNLSADTIIYTWITLGVMILLALAARYALSRPNSLGYRLVLKMVTAVINMTRQAVAHFEPRHAAFIGTLFAFILMCNLIVLIPGCEEPTKDLSTTLAVALISFFYTQKEALGALGFNHWTQTFFKFPFAVRGTHPTLLGYPWLALKFVLNAIISVAYLPLELMSKFTSVISLAFRLFGNIFGGSVITLLWKQKALTSHFVVQIIGIITGINLIVTLFFGLFEGLVQAFVFATLSVTYLGIGMSGEH